MHHAIFFFAVRLWLDNRDIGEFLSASQHADDLDLTAELVETKSAEPTNLVEDADMAEFFVSDSEEQNGSEEYSNSDPETMPDSESEDDDVSDVVSDSVDLSYDTSSRGTSYA